MRMGLSGTPRFGGPTPEKKWKPLTAQEERTLLDLIDQFFDQLEAEWDRLHE